jgi:hypothetical protein
MAMRKAEGATMKPIKAVGLLIDLLLLVASFSTGGRLADNIRIIALVVAGVAVALALFLCVLLAVLLLDQRQPPYPM